MKLDLIYNDTSSSKTIIFYDGKCNLCHWFIKLVFFNKSSNYICYVAPLQGKTAAIYRQKFSDFPAKLDTIVLIQDMKIYCGPKALAKIAKHLYFPLCTLVILEYLPSPIAWFFYNSIAFQRYNLFGRKHQCSIAIGEKISRFSLE